MKRKISRRKWRGISLNYNLKNMGDVDREAEKEPPRQYTKKVSGKCPMDSKLELGSVIDKTAQ